MRTLGVMCCGCNRMMTPLGKPLTLMRLDASGIPRPIGPISPEDIAWFPTATEADMAAQKAGWRAEDQNHRCPDCVAAEGAMTRQSGIAHHGAYVPREAFAFVVGEYEEL